MAMTELKQRLLRHELAKAGFPDADYIPATDAMLVQPGVRGMPSISGNGSIIYGTEHSHLAINVIGPISKMADELEEAWAKAPAAPPFNGLSEYRLLNEYNNVVLAARDDREYGRGLYFVTWKYNADRDGFDYGNYTDSYAAAKEDFAARAGLVPPARVLTREQAAAIRDAVEYRLDNDGDLTYGKDDALRKVSARLAAGYGLPEGEPEAAENPAIEETAAASAPETAAASSKAVNGEISPGDWVLVTPDSSYGAMIGRVTAIDKRGAPEHGTGNPGDDIHVDFFATEYPESVKEEILWRFDGHSPAETAFGDLALDDVIMAPEMLIRITGIGPERIARLAGSFENAEAYCLQAAAEALRRAESGMERGGDVMEITFSDAIIMGAPALFTQERIDRDSVPDGYYAYDIQYGRDWGEPMTIELNAPSDRYGTAITAHEIKMPPEGYVKTEPGFFFLLGDGDPRHDMPQFMEDNPPVSPRLKELLDRLDRNYGDYTAKLEENSMTYIIGMAGEIAAVNDAHYYLTSHHEFKDSEIDLLLCFENPLELISDEWHQRQDDISDMTFALDRIFGAREPQKGYALMPGLERPADAGLRRFMGVDLTEFLGRIAGLTIVSYPNEWQITKDELARAAQSDNPEGRRLMWHVCSVGCSIMTESEVYVKGSGDHARWTGYNQGDTQGYYVEVTGMSGGAVYGNVFEVGNYAEHARHIAEAALPCVSVTLVFNNGDTLKADIGEYEKDRAFYHKLHGYPLADVYHHAADNLEMAGLLNTEHMGRMLLTCAEPHEHIQKLIDKRLETRGDTGPAPAGAQRKQPGKAEKKPKMSIEGRLRAAQEKVDAQPPPDAQPSARNRAATAIG